MARISIKFDEELKQQVFMVRGDEAYARSTKTLLEIGNHNDSFTYFDLDVTVDVLRDVGSGQIVIYDNDDPIYLIDDWESTDTARTVTLEKLNYEIEHKIYAKYIGNGRCSPSKSSIQSITVNNTNKGISNITIDSTTTQFNPNATNVAKTITLTNDSESSWNASQRLYVYYDDTLVNEYTTNNAGVLTATIPDVGSIGTHTIKVVYAGSERLSAKTVTQTVSVGYKLYLTSTPRVIVKYHSQDYGGLLTAANSRPISGATVTLRHHSSSTASPVNVATGTTDSNGKVTITTTDVRYGFVSLAVTINGVTYTTDVNEITYFVVTGLDFNDRVTYYNRSLDLNPKVSPAGVKNVQIDLTGDVTATVYSKRTGVADYSIIGEKRGTRQITATSGGISKTANIISHIQDWNVPSLINENYRLYNCSFYTLDNYFKLASNNNHFLIGFPEEDLGDFELYMQFTTNANFAYSYLTGDWTDDVTYNWSATIPTNFPYNTSQKTWFFRRTNGDVYFRESSEGTETLISPSNNANPRFMFVGNSNAFELRVTRLWTRGL